ncbi:hypothetical protein BDR06DRAFT_984188 [Suillus hirtellus]|nr:hypothetical protein BDR06DRAFT_984188 [Suillus hirtellus]
MHECELGTWKALFTHLIRLLFHQVPTFGNGVIRKFANNTSEMKRLAAHDFEDILQCTIPVFEGLFPLEHDSAVQSLLYQFAQWHALVKLRIHSGSTLDFFEDMFNKLSWKLRRFWAYTCAAFVTTELPKEKAVRQRRLAQCSEINIASPESTGARTKRFNLNTYKFHAMGDYLRTIKCFGTTDSFTTQIGELAHRALKAFYPLTIADPPSSNKHHDIATKHENDPALKNFIPKLKDHVLYRLCKLDINYCDYTFTPEEHNSVIIPNDTIYSVQTMQVHYTTYDMRREYDIINPRTHANIMVLLGETTPNHPYWYAWVLGIYHVETWLNNGGRPVKQHLEFLWVRWMAPLRNHKFGMKYARLPKPGGELDDWEMYYVGIFIDRDMFIRYTHFGIGHPVMLWKIIRDCLDFESTGNALDIESGANEEVDVGYEENGAGDSCDGYSDEEEEEEEELSDEELEDEGNEDCEGDEDNDNDNDLLSF